MGETIKKVDGLTLKLYQGDITDLDVDAIVNAANNHLWMGGGVAGVIKRKGGPEIEAEAIKKGPIPVGEAVVTGAGRLTARYVIHAATMGQDGHTDETKVRSATTSALLRASELGVNSIALPALGAGVGGLPLDKVAKVMLGQVKKHAAQPTSLREVAFALYDQKAYAAFERALEGIPE